MTKAEMETRLAALIIENGQLRSQNELLSTKLRQFIARSNNGKATSERRALMNAARQAALDLGRTVQVGQVTPGTGV